MSFLGISRTIIILFQRLPQQKVYVTRMWADVQRVDRPAEYIGGAVC